MDHSNYSYKYGENLYIQLCRLTINALDFERHKYVLENGDDKGFKDWIQLKCAGLIEDTSFYRKWVYPFLMINDPFKSFEPEFEYYKNNTFIIDSLELINKIISEHN